MVEVKRKRNMSMSLENDRLKRKLEGVVYLEAYRKKCHDDIRGNVSYGNKRKVDVGQSKS